MRIMRGFGEGTILFYFMDGAEWPVTLDIYKEWKGYTPDLECGKEYQWEPPLSTPSFVGVYAKRLFVE